MTEADVDPLGRQSTGEAHEMGSIPRLNLQNDSTDQAYQISFSRPFDDPVTPKGPVVKVRESRFVAVDGEINGKSHNETNVDVVLVPCPGADPRETWTRNPLPKDVFKRAHTAVQMQMGRQLVAVPLHPALSAGSKPESSWARNLIRNEVSSARVLSYDHGGITSKRNLKSMADDLLRHLAAQRTGKITRRPLFFICHSIGGLVVKLALTQASRSAQYRSIIEDCYGVTFFATPHRGSSHLSNGDYSTRIQKLLYLSEALTPKLMDELKLDHPILIQIDENFRHLASELQIWTFYETEDSNLSGDGAPGKNEIPFMVPITSMRSAILTLRHERVYALQSNHADCASFGERNKQTLKMYLLEMGKAIRRAQSMTQDTPHVSLRLEQRVKIEVHGFYENDSIQDPSLETNLRLFSTKEHSLEEFWEDGPDGLLSKRLKETQTDAKKYPRDDQFVPLKGRARSFLRQKDAESEEPEPREQNNKPNRLSVVSAKRSRSKSRDDSKRNRTEQGAQHHDPNHVSVPADLSDGEHSPKSQAAPVRLVPRDLPMHRARAESLSLEYHSALQTNFKAPPSRSKTGSEFPVPDNVGFHKTSRPSSPTHGPYQPTIELQPPADINHRHARGRRGSEGTSRPDIRVSFKETLDPGNPTRKFVWVHVPFNNPLWVRKVFDTLSVKEERNYVELFNTENWVSRHARGRHSQHHACFLKPACGYIPLKATLPSGPSAGERPGPRPIRGDSLGARQPGQGCLYLYFPFLHFDSYKTLIKRRNMIKRRMAQGRTRPVPPEVAKEKSKELQIIWEYLGHDPPINCRRTLDQYRYPSLHDTRARDDDQMLYKMTKERAEISDDGPYDISRPVSRGGNQTNTQVNNEETLGDEYEYDDYDSGIDGSDLEDWEARMSPDNDVLDGKVLMIDQLWLWVVDTTSLVTFFPSREGDPMEGPLYQQADLRDSIFNEVNADLTRRCENALDLAALAVLHAVSVLIDRSSHPDLEIFRIFEEAISILTEKMTSSLKRFRTLGHKDRYGDDDVDLKTSSIRAKHKKEDERAERENQDNTSALLELRDIEDELSTMKHLFEEQEEQINTMHLMYSSYGNYDPATSSPSLPAGWVDSQRTASLSPTLSPLTNNGKSFLLEALTKLKSYKTQAEDMIERVQRTRHDFDKLLETVQRQAQIDEVRLSRQQADLASAQNRSIMIFTIFTVIFLPLSFFTGLFGMNTREWGGGANLHLQTIGSIALPASAFLIIVALVVAWSISVRKALKNMKRGVRGFKERTRKWWKDRIVKLVYGDDEKPRAKIGRRRLERKRKGLDEKKRRQRINREMTMQDFWERHREERESKYEIPMRNRRGTGKTSKSRAKGKIKKEKK